MAPTPLHAGDHGGKHNMHLATAWRCLTCEAGLAGARFHDLLHHAITELAETSEIEPQATSQERGDAPQVLKNLVDVTGIEPATPCLQSTKLDSNNSLENLNY